MLTINHARDALAETGTVIALTASVDEIVRRVEADDAHRPLLEHGPLHDRIENLLAERQDLYSSFDQVNTDGRTPDEVASAIMDLVNDRS